MKEENKEENKEKISLCQITSPYFCAGIVLKDGIVTQAAPIVKWMINKSFEEIEQYCNRKDWEIINLLEKDGKIIK